MVSVSVVIPTHNRSGELARAIKSVLNQTMQDFEIIVVDDFSTEDISLVINNFEDTRLKYFRLEQKGNANVARNVGIKISDSSYIAFLDSDDEYLPFHLERRLRKIEESKCDFIYGSAYVNTIEGTTEWFSRDLKKNEHPLNFLLSGGFAPTPSWFLKSDLAKKVQWNEHLKRHQDYDLFIRLSQGGELRCDNQPSVIINWSSAREIDFDNCIYFIDKYKNQLNPRIYLSYLKNMFDQAGMKPETIRYHKYYRDEVKKLIKHASLMEFLSFYPNKSQLKIQLLKLYFNFLVSTTTNKGWNNIG